MDKDKFMYFKKLLLIILLQIPIFGFAKPVFHDTQGNVIDFGNKWVVVNYWAPWCGICFKEIPELNSYYQNNKASDVVFVGVNYDHLPKDKLKQAIQKMDIQFPVLLEDPKNIYGFGELEILPTTFIINPKGKVAKTIIGPNTEESLNDAINYLR
jgi:thiol-disulfide isomerase/thioredoxin